jgi:hypothetical protein
MNRSRFTDRSLRLTHIMAALAAARAAGLARATATQPVLRPLDQGAPPALPGRIRLWG